MAYLMNNNDLVNGSEYSLLHDDILKHIRSDQYYCLLDNLRKRRVSWFT